MRRSSALLVSLLLVAGGAFAPLSAGADAAQTSPLIVPMDNTSNYLTVPANEVAQTGTTADGLSLSTAIDGDTTGIQTEFIRISFEQSFEAAETDTEKTTAIRDAADDVERRQQALERRDRAAVAAYANGSMTAAEFVRERARIHQEAQHLQQANDQIRTMARNDNSYSLSVRLGSRLSGLSGELEVLQGPVSEHAAQASGGDVTGEHLYVEAAADGYTLAYVTSDSYVRETYLGSEHNVTRSATGTQEIATQNDALDRGNDLYPWAYNHSISPNVRYLGSSGNFKYTAQHTSGELSAYISSKSGNVFRESQRHKLSAMPVSNTITATNESLDMRVNKTYESGPLHVDLSHNETSLPENATVTVNGEPVGHTGSDGSLWIVEPRGPDRITATTEDNETVSVYLPG